MTKYRVYPYKQGSRSAKVLAEALDGKVLKLQGSKFKGRKGDVVVNWGSTTIITGKYEDPILLNYPEDVRTASNKLLAFKAMSGCVSIPDFWENKEDIPADAYPIVCRTKLTGHSGEGIVIADTPDQLVDAPLYTKYVKKKDEYRVHIVCDEVAFIQRKARKLEVENPDWRVRNLGNGFVYAEADEDDVPENVIYEAQKAISQIGLDFGGVDVVWNEREQKAYVLEVNTACGLEERTARRYAGCIIADMESQYD